MKSQEIKEIIGSLRMLKNRVGGLLEEGDLSAEAESAMEEALEALDDAIGASEDALDVL